jgi:hypothetical protein
VGDLILTSGGETVATTLIDNISANVFQIGRVGENKSEKIEFDCSAWLASYPHATFAIFVRRPLEAQIYSPEYVERSGNILRWIIADSDVGKVGEGQFEIRMYENDVIKKSVIGRTKVVTSLTGTEVEPIPALSSWMDDAIASETVRVSSEGNRVTAENTRNAAEAARAEADESRTTAENMREANESQRIQNENNRIAAMEHLEYISNIIETYITSGTDDFGKITEPPTALLDWGSV